MADDLLSSAEALAETSRLIDSGEMAGVREIIRAHVAGARTLILGSAPSPIAPPANEYDRLICVNASPWAAVQLGLQLADILVLVGYTTNKKNEVSQESMRRLSGLRARTVLFVEVGHRTEAAQASLTDIGFSFDQFVSISPIERAAIIRQTCGEDLGLGARDSRISNGFFAALLALWGGAHEIVLAGMSMKGGHSYLAGETPRHHLVGDARCLELLAATDRISTTSEELGHYLD